MERVHPGANGCGAMFRARQRDADDDGEMKIDARHELPGLIWVECKYLSTTIAVRRAFGTYFGDSGSIF